MALDRPLALVGLSGSGKSTVGPLLADALGVSHIDLDRLIEEAADLPVAQIFAEDGEDGFRRLELDSLTAALDSSPAAVLSTGGGVVTIAAARALLKEKAFVIWLDAPVAELAARLTASVTSGEARPLLTGADGTEISLRRLAEERQGWYSEVSDLRVDVASCVPAEAANQILEKIR
jgi:shikimate kinase